MRPPQSAIASVPHTETLVSHGKTHAWISDSGTLVSHGEDASVPDSGVPYISNGYTRQQKTTPTPTPLPAGKGSASVFRMGTRCSSSNSKSLPAMTGRSASRTTWGRVMRGSAASGDPRLRLTIALAMQRAELARRQVGAGAGGERRGHCGSDDRELSGLHPAAGVHALHLEPEEVFRAGSLAQLARMADRPGAPGSGARRCCGVAPMRPKKRVVIIASYREVR